MDKVIIAGIILGVLTWIFVMCFACMFRLALHKTWPYIIGSLIGCLILGGLIGFLARDNKTLSEDVYTDITTSIKVQAGEDMLGYYNIKEPVLNKYYLDSCPVCHGRELIITYCELGATNDWSVECKDCGTCVYAEDGTLDEAIQRWNSLNEE